MRAKTTWVSVLAFFAHPAFKVPQNFSNIVAGSPPPTLVPRPLRPFSSVNVFCPPKWLFGRVPTFVQPRHHLSPRWLPPASFCSYCARFLPACFFGVEDRTRLRLNVSHWGFRSFFPLCHVPSFPPAFFVIVLRCKFSAACPSIPLRPLPSGTAVYFR